jgi:hypothetical protein
LSKEHSFSENTTECPIKFEKLLKKIKNNIREELNQTRDVMFSDIINYILRKDFKDDIYTKLIIWCNYKIRTGETYLKL